MGLCSDGNVHAGIDDIINMYELLVKNGFKNIYFHIITDGRDTDIHSSYKYIGMIEEKIKEYKVGSIATICGRYYAMDRDKNYDRTKMYYELVIKGIGIETNRIKDIIDKMYDKDITDEFLRPVLVNRNGIIKNGDILIWLNYRADRAKQIISSFTDNLFDGFHTYDMGNLEVYSFLPVDKNIPTITFLEEQNIKNPLGL